jgi:hypothetical protein
MAIRIFLISKLLKLKLPELHYSEQDTS